MPATIRADHIGSLQRPRELLDEVHRIYEAGHTALLDEERAKDRTRLHELEDEAIKKVVARQEELGLQVVTDGEFRRGTYSDSFTRSGITGVSIEMTEDVGFSKSDTHGHRMARRIPKVVDRIVWKGPQNAADFAFLKSVTTGTPKITLPGPCYIHYRAGRQNISDEAYPDLDAFWADLVQAYVEEMRSLAAVGCTYLQIDETSLVKSAIRACTNCCASVATIGAISCAPISRWSMPWSPARRLA